MPSNFDISVKKQAPEGKVVDVAGCKKCSCTWFEQFTISQFSTTAFAPVLGQRLVAVGESFVLLRCIQCAELHEPPVVINTQDYVSKAYYLMLDELDALSKKNEASKLK